MPFSNTPPIQEWYPEINTVVYLANNGIVSVPNDTFDILIKDIDPVNNNYYSDYRLIKTTTYSPNMDLEWLVGGVFWQEITPYNYGLALTQNIAFQNINQLPIGSFAFIRGYIIQGLRYDGSWQSIDTYQNKTILVVESVIPSPIVWYAPAFLNFKHTQNQNMEKMSVLFWGNLWKIVAKPNFILSSNTPGVTIQTIGSGHLSYQEAYGSGNAVVDIQLGNIYNSNDVFLPEDLAGQFEVFDNDELFGLVFWSVNVVRLIDVLDNPYPNNENAFTLDQKFLKIKSKNQNTYFQFDTLIKVYDFENNEKTITIPQKIVLFKGESLLNIGLIIHRLMARFSSPNISITQYKPAVVKHFLKEYNYNDGVLIRESETNEIIFIAGIDRALTKVRILDFNIKPNRVTQNSFAIINMYIPESGYELRTYKNGSLIESKSFSASEIIYLEKITFVNHNQGDVLEYVLDKENENNSIASKKIYKIFPKGHYSNHIIWEDEFLLQKTIECTGTAVIKSDFEFISQKKYQNLIEVVEHLQTTKENKLTINTGWLLESDVDTIESLCRSKRAWLSNSYGVIALSPITKSIINNDFEKGLIEFSLEFIINRKYDEETYTL